MFVSCESSWAQLQYASMPVIHWERIFLLPIIKLPLNSLYLWKKSLIGLITKEGSQPEMLSLKTAYNLRTYWGMNEVWIQCKFVWTVWQSCSTLSNTCQSCVEVFSPHLFGILDQDSVWVKQNRRSLEGCNLKPSANVRVKIQCIVTIQMLCRDFSGNATVSLIL